MCPPVGLLEEVKEENTGGEIVAECVDDTLVEDSDIIGDDGEASFVP